MFKAKKLSHEPNDKKASLGRSLSSKNLVVQNNITGRERTLSISSPDISLLEQTIPSSNKSTIKPQRKTRFGFLFGSKNVDAGKTSQQRNHNEISSSSVVNREVSQQEVHAFLDAIIKSGTYLQNLSSNHWEILKNTAKHGHYPESIDFLEAFNAYIKRKMTGEQLFLLLENLNIDDNQDKKTLDNFSNNELDSEIAKEAFKGIAEYIGSLVRTNLHQKQSDITYALQHADLSSCNP